MRNSPKEILGMPHQNSLGSDTASISIKKYADTVIVQKKDEKPARSVASDTPQTGPEFSKSIFLVDGKDAIQGSIPKTDNAEGISFTDRMRDADED